MEDMKCYKVGNFLVQEYGELDSTNTLAENLPQQELKDRMVILARRQTQGRGQAGNSCYVGDRKIAGILIEHRVAGACIATSLCGIGLNVNQREFLSDAPNPVSLWQLTGKELPLDQALEELLVCIDARYARICDYEGLQKDFLACLYRAEGVYGWRDSGGSFQASIAGLDEYGQLRLLDTEGKERVYAFKEVVYLP